MPRRSPYADSRDALVEAICAALAAGATLKDVCARPDMPRYWTVLRWRRADPAVKARLHAARGWSFQRDPAAREAAVRRLEFRLERGLTLREACRQPGAPSYQTVYNWCAEDPRLRDRLRRAQAWGVQFRPHHSHDRFVYDYDRVDRFIARVEAGEPVAAMQAAAGRRGDVPAPDVVRAWKAMRPEFVARYAAAKRKGAAARRRRPRRPFDPAVADRIIVRLNAGERLAALMREPGMPGLAAVRRWARAHPDFAYALGLARRGGRKNRARARSGPTPALARRIGRAIAMGASIRALCARKDMPTAETFYRWRRRYPEFDKKVRDAVDFRDWMLADKAVALAEEGTPEAQAEARRIMGRLRG